jgi:ribosome recycling factor
MEEIQFYLDEGKEDMEKAIRHTSSELARIRAGRATTHMVDGLTVEYYGSPTPLGQMASVTVPDSRTIAIKPFEKKMVGEVEKAIRNSDLGVMPQNDGETVRISIPPLSEERRRDLVKRAKNEVENGKVSIRNVRKETNEALRKLLKEGASEDDVKRAEEKVQALTDQYIGKADELSSKKEAEIMTI